jgi:hypothetical protein
MRLEGPVFEPLRAALARLAPDRWPTHAELTAAASGILTCGGRQLAFVTPREHSDRERRYYEVRVAQSGEVETRAENWHDLFNALAWITFPRAKAAINAQHAVLLAERGDAEALRRGPERDALTLFDEGGVAVVSSDPEVFRRIVDFEWKALFWHGRESLARTTRFIGFGHAFYEQMREPFLGLVAKTVFLEAADVAGCDVDARLAGHFADRARFHSPKAMAPMPVLGVPGWYPESQHEAFYDDPKHFRGKTPIIPT